MKITVAGGSGMIGSAVKEAAEVARHEVTTLHIPRPTKGQADDADAWEKPLEAWTPETFSGYDAVMFFGGEPINSRWTDKKVRRIELSRQMPCRRIAECCAGATAPPNVIVSASAVGYYGDRGDEILTEESAVGHGILPPTTAAWEGAWDKAREAGIRVVTLRFGVVLSPTGGALKLMLPAFKAGMGGKMGTGDQWMSWITLRDAARLAVWCAENDGISGPVNAVAPEPVRQHDFAKALCDALNRPAVIPAPEAALKLVLGRMAEETVLLSCHAVPAKAAEAGFQFNDFEIGTALRAIV